MNQIDQIKRIQLRARSYALSDGIVEMVGGGALVLIGGGFLLAAAVGSDTLRILSLVNMFALSVLSRWITRRLKDRITHPRTGYVRSPKPRLSNGQRAVFTVALILAGVLLRDHFGYEPNFQDWALLIAVMIACYAIRQRAPRLLFIVAAITATALVSWLTGMDGLDSVGLLATIAGASAILTGGFAFMTYLKQHPKNAEESP